MARAHLSEVLAETTDGWPTAVSSPFFSSSSCPTSPSCTG